jgi:uncharacterized damage-inducible protein DinB
MHSIRRWCVGTFCGLSVAATTPSLVSAQAVDPVMAGLRGNWEGMIDNITKSAEQMPEANYAFKPVATVRSFGELIAHVAGTQHLICGTVLGEKTGAEDDVEKSAKTKAAIVKALKESTDHCKKAYAITAKDFGGSVELFGGKNTKIGALTLNAVHDGEHYGNVVTYLRIKGMVPPSSQPAPAPAKK